MADPAGRSHKGCFEGDRSLGACPGALDPRSSDSNRERRRRGRCFVRPVSNPWRRNDGWNRRLLRRRTDFVGVGADHRAQPVPVRLTIRHYGWTMIPMKPSTTPRNDAPQSRPQPLPRSLGARRWLLLGAWLLMTPPVPLGTALPPLSEWSKLGSYETSKDCETIRENLRTAARRIVTNEPNATALQVAAALGRLQSRCVEVQSPQPPAAAPAAPPAGAPAAPPAGTAPKPAAP